MSSTAKQTSINIDILHVGGTSVRCEARVSSKRIADLVGVSLSHTSWTLHQVSSPRLALVCPSNNGSNREHSRNTFPKKHSYTPSFSLVTTALLSALLDSGLWGFSAHNKTSSSRSMRREPHSRTRCICVSPPGDKVIPIELPSCEAAATDSSAVRGQ